MYRFGEARPLWDFDEYTNYVAVNYEHSRHHHDRVVYVKTRETAERDKHKFHSKVLCFLDKFTIELQAHCKKKSNHKCTKLFIDTDHTFYELYHNPHYRGVNKPLKVHICKNAEHIGPDGIQRAHSRNVMVVIDENPVEMYKLYCHEIAHTFCNHVTYRPDDHHGTTDVDFPHNEQMVQRFSNELNLLNRLKKIYKQYA